MKLKYKLIALILAIICMFFSVFALIMISTTFNNSLSIVTQRHFDSHQAKKQDIIKNIVNYTSSTNHLQESGILYTCLLDSRVDFENYALILPDYTEVYSTLPLYVDKEDISQLMELENGYIIIDKDKRIFTVSKIDTVTYQAYFITSEKLDYVFTQRNNNIKIFCLFYIICSAIVFVSSIVFTDRITKPLSLVTQKTQSIVKGEFSTPLEISTNDEIEILANNFNTMSETLKENIEQLTLSAQEKENFMADFSHEIKTPMTSIMGYSSLIKENKLQGEDYEKAIDYIFSQTRRLDNLQSKMISLLGLGKNEFVLEKIHTEEIIRHTKAILPAVSQLLLVEDSYGSLVMADLDTITTLLKNLIENAFNASDNKKEVLLKIYSENNKVIISVTDFGRGISEEDLEKISKPFYVIDKSRSKMYQGTGLGLAICNKIIQLYNTQINYESKLGAGTVVTFTLEKGI